MGFKVFVNYTNDDKQEMKHVKILKLKKNKLSEPLLQYLRANLIASFQSTRGSMTNNYYKHLLVSAPVDVDFELIILKTGADLVGNMLRTKFETQLDEDQKILNSDLSWRKYVAVTHRTAQKEVLQSQEKILKILLTFMNRLKGTQNQGSPDQLTKTEVQRPQSISIKEAYMQTVEGLEHGEKEFLENRFRLRHYLREFELYSNKLPNEQ